MSKKTLRIMAAISALAGIGAMGLTLAPSTAQAGEIPPGCYKHPISGEIVCYPPPY